MQRIHVVASVPVLCAMTIDWIQSTQGDSGDATDDEMVSRKTRSCKEGVYRNGPESDSIEQEDPGDFYLRSCLNSMIEWSLQTYAK